MKTLVISPLSFTWRYDWGLYLFYKIMKLISMTDFLLHLRCMTILEICRAYPRRFREPVWKGDKDEMVKDMLALDAAKWDVVGEYAKLMKKKLELWMFVPCDEYGNALEDPKCECLTEYDREYCPYKCYQYLNAKNRVLFKGLTYHDIQPSTEFNYWAINGVKLFISSNTGHLHCPYEKIEDLTKHSFEVTDSFIKKLGL